MKGFPSAERRVEQLRQRIRVELTTAFQKYVETYEEGTPDFSASDNSTIPFRTWPKNGWRCSVQIVTKYHADRR